MVPYAKLTLPVDPHPPLAIRPGAQPPRTVLFTNRILPNSEAEVNLGDDLLAPLGHASASSLIERSQHIFAPSSS